MKVEKGEYYTVVVGMDDDVPELLVAPTGTYIAKDDIVTGETGVNYLVAFSTSYVEPTDRLFAALSAAFGEPVKIVSHMSRTIVEWGVKKNEGNTNTACSDDSRSRSGDGDGTEVYE